LELQVLRITGMELLVIVTVIPISMGFALLMQFAVLRAVLRMLHA